MIDHSELLPEGREIGGFRIEKAIGHGNMGIIYRAIQINLNRPVALKILFKSVAEDQDFVRSFFREAQAAAAFTHQNIVQAFDVGQSEDGIYYFAMELIEGGDISQQLKIRGKYSPVEALQYIVGIADGLDYGSNLRKLTHGDIKPANIMMTKSGKPKLADLGLARMGGEIQGESDGIMLTPLYAAPEMINGTWQVGDPRADMYSVGATLYHMISGQPPFYDPDYNKVIQMQLHNKHVPLTNIDPPAPAGVSKLVDKLLEKDPNKRFANWAEAKAAMEQAIKDPKGSGGKKKKKVLHYHDPHSSSDSEGQAEQSGRSNSISRKKKKSAAPYVILLIVAALLVGGFMFMLNMKKDMVGDEYAKLKKTFDGKKPEKVVKDIRNFIDVKKTVPQEVRDDLKKYQAMIKQRSLFYTSNLDTQKKSISRLEASFDENPKKTAGFIKKTFKSIESNLDAPGKKKIDTNGLVFHAPFNGNGLNHVSFYQPRETKGRVVFGSGMLEKCVDLKRTSIAYGDIPKLRFKRNSSFTISFWLKPATADGYGIINKTELNPDGKVRRGYAVSLKDGQLRAQFFGNTKSDLMVSTCKRKMIPNSWEHVILIYSGKNLEFYINGAKVDSDSTPPPKQDFSSTGVFKIGHPSFIGSLDDVRIWDRKIDKKEINELYAHKGKTPLEALIHRYNVLKFKAFFTKIKPDPKNPDKTPKDSKLKVHLGRLKSNFGNWDEINLTIAPILDELADDSSYQASYITYLKEYLPGIKKKATSAFNSPAFNVIKGEKVEAGPLADMFFNRADTRKASFHKKHEIYGTISRNFYWDEDESVNAAAEILKLLQAKKLFPYDNPAFCTLAALILEGDEVELLIEEATGSPYLELMKQIAEDRK